MIARSVGRSVGRSIGAGGFATGGAGPTFSPSDLTGLELWLDASDSSTVLNSISPDTPATDGQAIRRWLDKSGNDRHAEQTTGANQPLLDADGLNSKGVLTFDGINDFFTSGTTSTYNFLHNGTESLVVLVAKAGTTDNPDNFCTYLDTGAVTGSTVGFRCAYDDRSAFSRNNQLQIQIRNGVSGDVVLELNNDKVTPNVFNIIEMKVDADNATLASRSQSIVNGGAEFGSNAASLAASTADAGFPLHIARWTYTTVAYMPIEFAEIIICSDPNAANRENLRNYLASKWGITLA